MKKVMIVSALMCFLLGCGPAEEGEDYVIEKQMTLNFDYGERQGIYTGEIKNSLPDGVGTFSSKNDEGVEWTYTGEWKNGKMEGNGCSDFESGQKFYGEYSEGELNGRGIVFFPDSTVQYGIFENGELADNWVEENGEIMENTMTETIEGDSAENTFSWEEVEKTVPMVTYTDVRNGGYEGKEILLKCIVTDVKYLGLNNHLMSFNSWFQDDGFYYYNGSGLFDLESDIFGSEELEEVQSGDGFLLYTHVYEDGSIAVSSPMAVKKVQPEMSLEELKNAFKANCKVIDCEEILRNPEQYSGEMIKISGEVFQTVEETGEAQEFLLNTDSGEIVYVFGNIKEGEGRILEGDRVEVYGIVNAKLKSYYSVMGTEKTVVGISGEFIDLK